MRTITVKSGGSSYAIINEAGLLAQLGTKVREVSNAQKVALITDSNVDRFYGLTAENALKDEGFAVRRIVIAPGEGSKNLATLGAIYNELAAMALSRTDLIVTLGGGVVGDIGGLAAATYLRGVDFVQVPTSLLAQVDSSVGGKVAVDLPAGKNLVGAFYQPRLVLIDPKLLATLPTRYLHDGLAEVIKYGAICDAKLYTMLSSYKSDAELLSNMEEIIYRSYSIKAAIVERDPYDRGERMVLNFGHTIGHAVEQAYAYGRYTHGEAVAIGMVRLTQVSEAAGLTQQGTAEKLQAVAQHYGLPVETELSSEELYQGIIRDKKKAGDKITLVLLHSVGSAYLQQMPLATCRALLQGGLL